MNRDKRKANKLANETSPYLLQHAYNPVEWYPWGNEALEKAVQEDKPILVSIGYSSCHWCHVMERESFEDDTIANFMNEHFISIKIDREERPDIDQIYMDAVQAMGINGGWPLNVFLTPEKKPFYGGTYFPPPSWLQLLKNVNGTFRDKRMELNESALQLTSHISRSDIEKFGLIAEEDSFSIEKLAPAVNKLSERFDRAAGGIQKAPKFPMPSLWLYLLRYGFLSEKQEITDHVLFTLEKMARGGIYDQVGGGFARYAVDALWFAPHFEKMLYDNGQLIALFSEAYILSKKQLFKEVVDDSIEFLQRELMSEKGGFYSALDADSEGVEGKFYTWTSEELKKILNDEYDFWQAYFGTSEEGNWENGVNILIRTKDLSAIEQKFGIKEEEARNKLDEIKKRLLEVRSERIRPGLDDKILASWNGLALKGLVKAYEAFKDERFLELAIINANYLKNEHIKDSVVYRNSYDRKNPIRGYLDDYAFVIDGFIALYQYNFDETWINIAKDLIEYVLEHFYDEKEGMFFYTDDLSENLITRKKEVFDNVIPCSNSAMAHNLHFLGLVFDNNDFTELAKSMTNLMTKLLYREPEYLSNWGRIYLKFASSYAEIAISGKEYTAMRDKISNKYYPNKLFCGAESASSLPLLKNRESKDGTTIYVCYNKTCKLPVKSVEEALNLLE